MTKLLSLNQAAADSLIQFKRLVINFFPDLAPDPASIRLEYQDQEGHFLEIEEDGTLRSAITELNASGKVPKFWASWYRQPGTNLLPTSTGETACDSWAADKRKRNRLKTGSTSRVPPQSRHNWPTAFTAPCKYYSQTGWCRNGADCRYSHTSLRGAASSVKESAPESNPEFQPTSDLKSKNRNLDGIPASDVSSLSLTHLRYWLQQQLEQPASTNFEDLSCEDSDNRRIFVSILERRNLSELVVDKLVELLTREEIRSSMMRHNTDRIYGLLMGSLFMAQLQSHIQGLVNPTPRKMHMYLRLVEEPQGRTSADGWKGVPLDAIKRVVDDMERRKLSNGTRDTAVDDLLEDVNRLLKQRDKLRRLRDVSTGNCSCEGEEDFLRLPILPSDAEMVTSDKNVDNVSRPLPVNHVGRQYSSVPEYLETHFQLLREDYIETFRQGIHAFKIHKLRQTGYSPEEEPQDLTMYVDVRFEPGLKFGQEDIERQVEFRVLGGRDINWESSKRLMFGTLLCVSEDDFQTFFWALVVRREAKDLARGRVTVRLITESDLRATHKSASESTTGSCSLRCFERSQRFMMAESPYAYFEAYVHVLRTLQRADMCRQLVFTKHIIDLEPKVGPPSYLAGRPQHGEFNFSTVFPELMSEIGSESFDIFTSWPEWKNCALDDSQKNALKHGLTKELALIQGPPGTWKTYVGLLLVKCLLANLKQEKQQDTVHNQQDAAGPILVVCTTYHALDQFLLGICEFEKNLIRIGRSKHTALMPFTLGKLVNEERQARSADRSHSRAYRAARYETKRLESLIEEKFLRLTNLTVVNRSVLRDQIERLSKEYKEACKKN